MKKRVFILTMVVFILAASMAGCSVKNKTGQLELPQLENTQSESPAPDNRTVQMMREGEEASKGCFNFAAMVARLRDTAELKGESIGEVPLYDEMSLLRNNYKFQLGIDSSCYMSALSSQINDSFSITGFYPTEAIRLRDKDSVYSIYDTDTGYRLFILFDSHNDYYTPDGFPIIIKNMLSYEAFSGLTEGDPIEKVEAIDSVATLHKEIIMDDNGMVKTMPSYSQNERALTSIHYLTDGILKIEYEMLENRDLIISNIVYSKDYTLVNARGRTINYRLIEADLPKK